MFILKHKCHPEHRKCLFKTIIDIRNIENVYFKSLVASGRAQQTGKFSLNWRSTPRFFNRDRILCKNNTKGRPPPHHPKVPSGGSTGTRTGPKTKQVWSLLKIGPAGFWLRPNSVQKLYQRRPPNAKMAVPLAPNRIYVHIVIHMFIDIFIHMFIHYFIYLFIQIFIHWFIHKLTHRFIHILKHIFIHTCMLCIYWYLYLYTYLYVYLNI